MRGNGGHYFHADELFGNTHAKKEYSEAFHHRPEIEIFEIIKLIIQWKDEKKKQKIVGR